MSVYRSKTGSLRYLTTIIGTALAATFAVPAHASVAFLTFDNLATGPSLFADAGPAQTIVYPQATFTGGVVLGDETNLPAQSFGTPPNVYGTASANVITGADPSLLETLKIAISPTFATNEVSFPLFNGNTVSVTYVVDAFSSSNALLASQTLNLASNLSSGFGIVDLQATGISSVTIAPQGLPSGWDFSIDSVALNESVQTAFAGGVPEPSTWAMMIMGFLALGVMMAYRNKSLPRVA
jgi:hypothetical protein